MKCPVCRKAMIALELHEVEIDHCVGCGGIWLDAGELELLLDGAADRDRVMNELVADPSISEAPRKCPICDKRMEKVRGGGDGDVIVDRCSAKGDGMWLDKGELHRLVEKLPGDNRVHELLVDVFGNPS